MTIATNDSFESRLIKAMQEDGKSRHTIMKYVSDVRQFLDRTGNEDVSGMSRETVQEYRSHLSRMYRPASANSKISAVNYFLKTEGRNDLCAKHLKVQHNLFRPAERELTREEYFRLLKTAEKHGNHRLNMLMKTIASTGIRVSEVSFVTVESLAEQTITITLKGKIRNVLMPSKLCLQLKEYAAQQNIRSGRIFITRNGNPLDRTNIIHDMKELCEEAGVARNKVFPHNLRHLFAVTYYQSVKDLSHLADILGHSNLNTTRIYTSMSYSEHLKQIEQIGLLD